MEMMLEKNESTTSQHVEAMKNHSLLRVVIAQFLEGVGER
jgi:hypothetical protein